MNFLIQIFCYGLYFALTWLLHLAIVSVIFFFHFQLDHSLGIIEEWMFDTGWELISVTKIISLYIMMKFINLKSNLRRPTRSQLTKGAVLPSKELFVMLIFLLFMTIALGRPQMVPGVDFKGLKLFTSFAGQFIFYMTDLLVLSAAQNQYPLKKMGKTVRLFLFPLLFLIFSKATFTTFLYGKNMDYHLFFHFLVCLYLSEWRVKNWSVPAIYLLLFACPISTFFGLDPVWMSLYSQFEMSKPLGPLVYLVLVSLALGYMSYKKRESGNT